VAVFYGFFIHELLSKPLPRQIDSTPAIKGNLIKIQKKNTKGGEAQNTRSTRVVAETLIYFKLSRKE